jgi:glycerophosphoryl diester phosphodiesterase
MRLSLSALLDRLLAPPRDPARTRWMAERPYAHRGLYGFGVIENSRAAFEAALKLGHGIELDVQAASGGEAFVFHDATLDRLTEESGPLADRLAYELDRIRLRGSHETIPRLAEILAMVNGQVPVLIEVKARNRHVGTLCLAVRRALEGYRGPVAIMSFNPEVGRWFLDHSPRTVRGVVMTESDDIEVPSTGIKGRIARHASLWRAKPDFLAYDIRNLPSRFAAAQRARGLKLLTWTVRSGDQEKVALACADEMIYERPGARG